MQSPKRRPRTSTFPGANTQQLRRAALLSSRAQSGTGLHVRFRRCTVLPRGRPNRRCAMPHAWSESIVTHVDPRNTHSAGLRVALRHELGDRRRCRCRCSSHGCRTDRSQRPAAHTLVDLPSQSSSTPLQTSGGMDINHPSQSSSSRLHSSALVRWRSGPQLWSMQDESPGRRCPAAGLAGRVG